MEHVDLVGALTTEDMQKKKEHNQAMVEITSALRYAKFDDLKGWDIAKKMWDVLHTIYGGEKNVQKDKFESLRGKFDDMRMEEGENVSQYVSRRKEVVNAIRSDVGHLDDETIL